MNKIKIICTLGPASYSKTILKTLSKENIDNWIDTVSRGQGNRAEIENYYLNNEDAKKNMESVILENLAVKWVVDNAKVAEKDYSFDELVELR